MALASAASDAQDATAAPRPLPFAAPAPGPDSLSPQLLYTYLTAELGAQRGELPLAYFHYLEAARLGAGADAAELATNIAVHLRDLTAALQAAQLWIELAPNASLPRQTAALLHLRNGQVDLAQTQFEALLQIAQARGEDGYARLGNLLAQVQNRKHALALMQALSAPAADTPEARRALAVVQLAADEHAAAEAGLRQVLADRPEWSDAWVLLARALVLQGRQDDAIAALAGAVDRFPQDRLLRSTHARLLIDAERYGDAAGQFRAVLELAPDDPDVLYALGMLAIQAQDWAEAQSAWQALRSTGERYDEASYFLAQVEEQLGNPTVAIGLYRAVSEGEIRPDARLRLASLLADRGELPAARAVLGEVRILHPERAVDTYLIELVLLQEAQAREAALALYEHALTAYPDNEALLYQRALYAADLGRMDWLERDLARILESNPEHADALNALGYALAERNERLPEALALIERAHRLKPDSAAVLDSMGWVHYRLGNMAEALDYVRRAFAADPDPEIAAHLGELLWVSGERERAQQVWQESLQRHPDSDYVPAAMQRLGVM